METKHIAIISLMVIFLCFIYCGNELFEETPQGAKFFNEPIFTSGASQRFFGTTFTGTDQGKTDNTPIPGYDYS